MKHKALSVTGSTRGTAYTMSNKILTHAGKTHVAWLDQICRIYVRTHHHRTRRWGRPVCVGTGDDNHAGAAFAMDSRGYLHLAFGPHHNPIRHVVSRRPNTSTSWVEQPSFGGTTATYPSLVCDAEDTLHACYRGSYAAERPWSLVYQKKTGGGEWTDPVKLVDPEGPPAYTQFENALHMDRSGALYLAYHIVRATEADYGDTRGRGFGVMRSCDGGENWQTVDGTALELPTTPASPCVIEFDEGLDVRMGNVATGGRGTLCFTLNRRENGAAETFVYTRRKNDWRVVSLMPRAEELFGDCEMSDVCALSIADDGVIYAAGPVCRRGGDWADSTNEIALFTSRDGGETFSGYRISTDEPDVSNWLPALERHTGHNRVDVPRLVYTHGHAGEGCSPDIDTEIRYVSLNGIAEAEAGVADARVAGSEQLSGIRFTDEQRGKMRRDVEQYRLRYRELREVDVGYDVSPASIFLPGVKPPPSGERRAFRLTASSVERPESREDLAFLPVSALARLVETRQVSPTEITRLYLDRLDAYGEALHCVVSLTEDLAMAQAKAAEAEIMAGRYRGPLHGIPWGAKDLLATKGIRTTWGATPFREQTGETDAAVVERLRDAGAVLVAKLSTGALANGPHWFGGMTRNPWNTETGSSGSSAGPGAATAAGLVGFSIGSETLGSIVGPSHTCGVTGLRPTYGRVSRYGAMALAWTMDKLGPMCRGVEDCAAVFSAIHGPDGRDRSVVDAPFNWPAAPDAKGLRIGYIKPEFDAIASSCDRAVYQEAFCRFEELGLRVEPVTLPACPHGAVSMMLCVEAAAAFDSATRAGELDAMIDADKSSWPTVFRSFRMVPAVEYLRAQQVRSLMIRDMEELMGNWDVLLAPGRAGASLATTNLTGHPALTLKCGFADGMPLGLTLIGNLYDEATVLAAGLAYEQATEWHNRHPHILSALP